MITDHWQIVDILFDNYFSNWAPDIKLTTSGNLLGQNPKTEDLVLTSISKYQSFKY